MAFCSLSSNERYKNPLSNINVDRSYRVEIGPIIDLFSIQTSVKAEEKTISDRISNMSNPKRGRGVNRFSNWAKRSLRIESKVDFRTQGQERKRGIRRKQRGVRWQFHALTFRTDMPKNRINIRLSRCDRLSWHFVQMRYYFFVVNVCCRWLEYSTSDDGFWYWLTCRCFMSIVQRRIRSYAPTQHIHPTSDWLFCLHMSVKVDQTVVRSSWSFSSPLLLFRSMLVERFSNVSRKFFQAKSNLFII